MIVALQVATPALATIEGLQAATAALAMIMERAAAEAVTEAAATAETAAVAAQTEVEAVEVRKAEEEDLPAPGLVESKCKRDVADSECQPQAMRAIRKPADRPHLLPLLLNLWREQAYHTPLSLPVILKATAAADASGGNRLSRNVAGTSPRNAVSVSWRVYRRAP